MKHQLAQVNIARMRASLDDPLMAGFTDNIERINALGAAQPGFVWIMSEGDEHGGNTDVRFYGDDELIVNLTVWESVEALMDYALRTEHVEFLRRRRDWFVPMDEAHLALWWVPEGHRPTIAEAESRLTHLRDHGPTATAFTPRETFPPPVDDAAEWDARYRGEDDHDHDHGDHGHLWSGQPNGSLVSAVTEMPRGTVLDVGCGEGADAVWLASQGWTVTAVDPSGVALERARAAAAEVGVDGITWVHSGLAEMPDGTGTYDLVSAQYPALRTDPEGTAIGLLLDAVAPGGTLLFVHHAVDPDHADDHGFDPADYVMPADVASALDDSWTIEVHETRGRPGPLSEDARHRRDVVLRARRAPA